MSEIIPAIMPENIRDLEEKLGLVAEYVQTVQLDIMDGHFVKPRTWPYAGDRQSFQNILSESEGLPFWDEVDFEIDLMVGKPEEVIDAWINAGASRLIVHIESTKYVKEIVQKMSERFAWPESGEPRDVELGLALNPSTPISEITGFLEDIDFVQFMGIDRIGYQGEEFDEHVLDLIRNFHNAHPEVIISVDGGVNFDNAHELVEAGVKRLVSGSVIFEAINPAKVISDFKRILKGVE